MFISSYKRTLINICTLTNGSTLTISQRLQTLEIYLLVTIICKDDDEMFTSKSTARRN